MDRIQWLTIGGMPVMHLNLAGITDPEEALAVVEAAKQPEGKHRPHGMLSLTEVAGGRFDRRLIQAIRSLIEHNQPYVKAGAVVGLSGLQRVMYDSLLRLTGRRNLHAFSTVDEAKAWLEEQATGERSK